MRPEAAGRRDECPRPERWSAPDSYASEREVSRFLGDLVRLLKPLQVVETGSYFGHTSREIGMALAENGEGRLISIERDAARASVTAHNVTDLPVIVQAQDSLTVTVDAPIDLLFLDSEFETRMAELQYFRPMCSPACVVVLHDSAASNGWPGVSVMYDRMEALVREGVIQPWLKLPTPRGLAMTRFVS